MALAVSAAGLCHASAAGFASAVVSFELVPLSNVNSAAVTQLVFGTSTGAYTVSIPGATGGAVGGGLGAEAKAPAGGLTLTSADGSPPSGEQLAALTITDGTLNGDQGMSFSFASDGSTQLVATVAYN